jgi:hypothetical protein
MRSDVCDGGHMTRQPTDTQLRKCFRFKLVDRQRCCGQCSQLRDSRKGTLGFLGSLTMSSERNPFRYLAKTSRKNFAVPLSIRSVDPAICVRLLAKSPVLE